MYQIVYSWMCFVFAKDCQYPAHKNQNNINFLWYFKLTIIENIFHIIICKKLMLEKPLICFYKNSLFFPWQSALHILSVIRCGRVSITDFFHHSQTHILTEGHTCSIAMSCRLNIYFLLLVSFMFPPKHSTAVFLPVLFDLWHCFSYISDSRW